MDREQHNTINDVGRRRRRPACYEAIQVCHWFVFPHLSVQNSTLISNEWQLVSCFLALQTCSGLSIESIRQIWIRTNERSLNSWLTTGVNRRIRCPLSKSKSVSARLHNYTYNVLIPSEQNTVGRTTSTTTSAFSPKAKTLHLVVRYTVK